jgi:hypothetical protein
VSPGSEYAAPSPGVITAWSYQGGVSPPALLKLKVGRPAGLDAFTIVAQSGYKIPAANSLNTFTDVRIPVQAGDVIGFYSPSAGWNCEDGTPGYTAEEKTGDQLTGTTTTYLPETTTRLNISATLEPDCDGDGFGDETQDPDTVSCNPVPDTAIVKGPKDKSRKKQARFEFSSSIPGALFECSLDGGAFAACTSPDTLKVKRGKHSFAVRATAGGQTDASPASDDWKVKKKRKK